MSCFFEITLNNGSRLELNNEIIEIDPEESLPYVNFGNYYMILGAIKVLDSIEHGNLRVDRTLDFSVSDKEKRKTITMK